METNKSVLKIIIILLLVFTVGFFAGIGSAVTVWYLKIRTMPFMQNPAHITQLLTRTLNLNEKQQAEVRQIVSQTGRDLIQLRNAVRPKIRQRLELAQQQIASVLTAEQTIKFNQLVERRKALFRRWQERRLRWLDNTN